MCGGTSPRRAARRRARAAARGSWRGLQARAGEREKDILQIRRADDQRPAMIGRAHALDERRRIAEIKRDAPPDAEPPRAVGDRGERLLLLRRAIELDRLGREVR